MSKKNIRNAFLFAVLAATTITQALAAEEPLQRSKRMNLRSSVGNYGAFKEHGPVTVKNVALYEHPEGGWAIEMEFRESITTPCATTNATKRVTQWQWRHVLKGFNVTHHNALLNALMSAQAQGKKVIMVLRDCHPKFGAHLGGLKILGD